MFSVGVTELDETIVNASFNAAASRKRSDGSYERQRMMIASNAGETSGLTALIGRSLKVNGGSKRGS